MRSLSRDVFIFALILFVTIIVRSLLQSGKTVEPAVRPAPVPPVERPRAAPPRADTPRPKVVATSTAPPPHLTSVAVVTPPPPAGDRRPKGPPIVPFKFEDGVAVTMTDVVIGVPERPEAGLAALKVLKPWRGREIAYYIQTTLPNPERVLAAFRLFEGTPIHFTPLTNQDDALVFEPGTGACKSYLGRIGGKQPIWLSPGCGPTEIAHEIMHALGFIHEQNRPDRDGFIKVLDENVEPGEEINFTKLSKDYMTFSGMAPFDYTSVMIYPKTLFGVGGRDTLESVRPNVEIEPSRTLSPADRARLTRAFGEPESEKQK